MKYLYLPLACLIFFHSSKLVNTLHGSGVPVEVSEGEDASLICNVSIDFRSTIVVSWMFRDQTLRCGSRCSNFSNGDYTVLLDRDTQTSELIVRNVAEINSGNYTCLVSSDKDSQRTTVELLVKLRRIFISDYTGRFYAPFERINVTIGTQRSFKCFSDSRIKPPYFLAWETSLRDVQSRKDDFSLGNISIDLGFTNYEETNLTCMLAIDVEGETPERVDNIRHTVLFDKFCPVIISDAESGERYSKNEVLTVTQGSSKSFVCLTEVILLDVYCFRWNTSLPGHQFVEELKKDCSKSSNITISFKEHGRNKLLSCEIKHGISKTISSFIFIDIIGLLNITSNYPLNSLEEGMRNVRITCFSSPSTSENKLSWLKNQEIGQELDHSTTNIISKQTLFFNSLNVNDAGIYTCTIDTSIGPVNESIKLRVHYSPRITDYGMTRLAESDTQQIHLYCFSESLPVAKIKWIYSSGNPFRGSRYHPNPSIIREMEYGMSVNSSLIIDLDNDEKDISCISKNNRGESRVDFNLAKADDFGWSIIVTVRTVSFLGGITVVTLLVLLVQKKAHEGHQLANVAVMQEHQALPPVPLNQNRLPVSQQSVTRQKASNVPNQGEMPLIPITTPLTSLMPHIQISLSDITHNGTVDMQLKSGASGGIPFTNQQEVNVPSEVNRDYAIVNDDTEMHNNIN